MQHQPAAAAEHRASFRGAHMHKGQGLVDSQQPDSSRGRCAQPGSRSSFASAKFRAASPTATRRTLLAQPRLPLLSHRIAE
eukprot:1375224-Prymnesium_polylepis.1